MITEKEFFSALSESPQVPSAVFQNIEHTITRQRVIKKSILALAASLILTVGSVYFYQVHSTAEAIAYSELVSEMTVIQDYFNGSDIEQEFSQYAFVDDSMF